MNMIPRHHCHVAVDAIERALQEANDAESLRHLERAKEEIAYAIRYFEKANVATSLNVQDTQ